VNGRGVRLIARNAGYGALAVGTAGSAVAFVAYRFVRCGERETLHGTVDAIVVLGAQVHGDGRPSAALRGRVQRAAVLYHAGSAPRVVVTGGVGESGIAEAAVMEAVAVAYGVPAAAIVLEARATRTLESAVAVGALARDAGWRSVIVVSDPFHLWRSALLFRAEGLAVQTAATDDRYFSARSRRYYWMRETAALIVQTVNGEIPLNIWREMVSGRRSAHDD
jgi:uncharacterized SAM-binding protein YcdF (DUF218 family)